jgi:hypothetical protein
MRKITISTMVSLDGVMGDPPIPGQWRISMKVLRSYRRNPPDGVAVRKQKYHQAGASMRVSSASVQ